MDTTPAYTGLECVDCQEYVPPGDPVGRCPACGGILDARYEYDAVDLSRRALEARPLDSLWRYDELLPFPRAAGVSMHEGGTPLVDCPNLAEDLGVGQVLLKDEGRNPTGTFKDRGQSLAVTAARQHGAAHIALASAGNAGQSAAAYAARAGLSCHVFLPSRAGFTQKAMVRVHGGDLTVVDGGIDAASAAYADAMETHEEWYPVQSFATPYRHEGKKTMFFELVEQLEWDVPDAIVYPTGGGVGLVGMHKGARELNQLGLIDDVPEFYAAQSSGCAPIVAAWEDGVDTHERWEEPETVCGGIEIPDPGASRWILDVLDESAGGAIATADEAIVDAATTVARRAGLEIGATPAAAVSGAMALADRGAFDDDATVVLLATGGGNKDADILRGHVMARDAGDRDPADPA